MVKALVCVMADRLERLSGFDDVDVLVEESVLPDAGEGVKHTLSEQFLGGSAGDLLADGVGVEPEGLACSRAGHAVVGAPGDSVNPALERWYDYGFTSHLLTPKPGVYAVRTAEGDYAALRFLSYYCPGARAGCVTFEYVYQGDGSRLLR